MFERFTDQARRVVVLAQDEARRLNHNYIGTEHLLLGLIQEREGVAAKALNSLGIGLKAVRQQVEEIIGQGEGMPSGHIPFTPRAKKVLELSLREALDLGHNYIGTEHILLGLIREGEGVAGQVLVKLGAERERVRDCVVELIEGGAGEGIAPGPAARSAGPRAQAGGVMEQILARLEAIEVRLSRIERRLTRYPEPAARPAQTGAAPAQTGAAPAQTGAAPAEASAAQSGATPAQASPAPAQTGATPGSPARAEPPGQEPESPAQEAEPPAASDPQLPATDGGQQPSAAEPDSHRDEENPPAAGATS